MSAGLDDSSAGELSSSPANLIDRTMLIGPPDRMGLRQSLGGGSSDRDCGRHNAERGKLCYPKLSLVALSTIR